MPHSNNNFKKNDIKYKIAYQVRPRKTKVFIAICIEMSYYFSHLNVTNLNLDNVMFNVLSDQWFCFERHIEGRAGTYWSSVEGADDSSQRLIL